MMRKTFFPIVFAGIWITLSEFLRNEFLLKTKWINHFASLGLEFKTLPIHGILWFIWSLLFAYLIFKILQRFTFWETLLISWIAGFVMMWIPVFNLQVLPLNLLLFAFPLSLIEVFVAELIIKKIVYFKH